MIVKTAQVAAGVSASEVKFSSIEEAPDETKDRLYLFLIFFLGVISAVIVAAYHNVADGDLWAKLSLGASLWERGILPRQDLFAFTPVLPQYVDHEWGAGAIFYGLLRTFGPGSLLVCKIALFCGTLIFAIASARRNASWTSALLLAIPGGLCLLPGFVPVIRSHTLTFFFFALTLWSLEAIRRGERWPGFLIIALMAVWTNVHGGFVAGLGLVGVYAVVACIERKESKAMIAVLIACGLVTLINPYGPAYWKYLVPALLHKRPMITEWGPMPLFAWDAFVGFRVLFLFVAAAMIAAWKQTTTRSVAGVIMLAITAYLAWSSRRHAPFFAVTAITVAAPYVDALTRQIVTIVKLPIVAKVRPLAAVAGCYCCLAFFVITRLLGQTSFQVLAPVGTYPVREVDILSLAAAAGNVAVPFSWGSYVSWRLYPNVKVSIDGRYEAVYPEETFLMNESFFRKSGADWEALIKRHDVHFVILDLTLAPLRPADLKKSGFELIWHDGSFSALLARGPQAALLRQVAGELPPTTIEPLDARIPNRWPAFPQRSVRSRSIR